MKKIVLSFIASLIVLTGNVNAQMNTSNTAPFNSATNLVNDVLLGQGVTATNITFTGDANQLGFFNNGNLGTPALGLDSGIVISSGNINDIPNGGAISTDFGNPGDPDLVTIAQTIQAGITSSNDAAALEFDFTPLGDTVEFRFVFASDEYTQWINSVYNDIFAFFISGPGITGPYASPALFPNGAINIAQVPGTTDPITISTIYNDPTQVPTQVNGQYYIDNPNGTNNSFNGFTTVFTVKYYVQCGGTYHFKLAIADCEDGTLDTGVFLEGSSFSSESVQVNVVTATGDSTVIEGCADATINFTRPDTLGEYTVHYVIGGNAINGVDYVQIADSITFLAGQDTAFLNINPIADLDFTEGEDTISITAFTINACGDTITSIGYIYILDLPNMVMNSHDTILDCPLTNLPIYVEASQALEPFTYSWFSDSINGPLIGSNNDTLIVSGMVTDTFYVSVTDSCNLVTINDTIIVTINTPPLEFLNIFPDSTINCGETITLSAIGLGGTVNYTYSYSPAGPTISPQTTTDYTITVTDACLVTKDSIITITVDTIPVIIETINDTLLYCDNQNITLTANPNDGVTPYIYTWTPGGNGASVIVSPSQTTTYYVTATGGCNANSTDSVIATVIYTPMTLSLSDPGLQECPNKDYTLEIIATVENGTMPYTYNWDVSADNDSIINFTVSNPGQLVSLTITDDCFNPVSASVNISYGPYTPMVINALPVDSVCIGETRELNATVTDGIPPHTPSWSDGINSYSGIPTMYSSLISGINNVILTVTDKCGIQESSNVDVLVIPCSIITPNVFTPNGDAFNQTLVFENLEFFPNNNITIFNRWGNKIYEKENYQNDWDGNGASVGTYYYIINLNNIDNKTHKGTFTILK